MNILIIHHDKGFYGGAEEVVMQLQNFLRDRWHKVVVVYESNSPLLWAKAQQWITWSDVINVHNFPASLAAYPAERPIVWMCNEPPELFTNWWRKSIEALNRRWVRNSGMRVVVADNFNADRFESIYGVKPTVIPYGVNYDFWSQGVRSDDGLVILQVGHPELFDRGKRILREVQGYIPYATLRQIMGTTHDEVRAEYYKASVLIHPIGSQGGWLVPFEAMCAGLPVVISLGFSGVNIIKEHGLGVVTDNMASNIVKEEYKKLNTTRIKGWVKENLTWEKFGRSMVRVFEEAITERKNH